MNNCILSSPSNKKCVSVSFLSIPCFCLLLTSVRACMSCTFLRVMARNPDTHLSQKFLSLSIWNQCCCLKRLSLSTKAMGWCCKTHSFPGLEHPDRKQLCLSQCSVQLVEKKYPGSNLPLPYFAPCQKVVCMLCVPF